MSSNNSKQSTAAQSLYDTRSTTYDNSWHVRFARHMIQLLNLQPGELVLDLACGTGLATFPADDAVGSEGRVIGVDVSQGMLEQARQKLEGRKDRGEWENVEFYGHDIADLGSLHALYGKEGSFDAIVCASALVLLEEPGEAVKHWTEYLKPGGRLIVDVTHPSNQVVGMVFERVGIRLGRRVSYHRSNFQEPGNLEDVLKRAGLKNVEMKAMSQLDRETGEQKLESFIEDINKPRVSKVYGVGEAGAVFEAGIDGPAMKELAQPDVREKAKGIFLEEWTKIADEDEKVHDVDCVWVGIGYKA